jgi:adenylate cyclase 10
MKRMQNIIYRFEGSLNKLLMENKGLIFLIGFGLPPICHEDDPLRAVKAVMQMKAELSEAGLGYCCVVALSFGSDIYYKQLLLWGNIWPRFLWFLWKSVPSGVRTAWRSH